MATPARSRVRPYAAPGETVVLNDAAFKIRRGSRFTLGKVVVFVRRVIREEPTLIGELASWGFIASWSYSLLMYRTATLPPSIAQTFESGSYFIMAIIGAVVAVTQLVAMISLNETFRAACSFAAAMWLGGLATALFAGDARVPSGLGYVLLSFLSLSAYWRVHPRLLLNAMSGAVALLRSGGGPRS